MLGLPTKTELSSTADLVPTSTRESAERITTPSAINDPAPNRAIPTIAEELASWGDPTGEAANAAGPALIGGSETDQLSDQDDVDAPRHFLVYLENLTDEAVLSVGRVSAGILENQAVAVDPLVSCFQIGHELLCPNDE